MSTFDQYLLRRFLHVFLMLFICCYSLYVVIDGFSNIDAFQKEDGSTGDTLELMGTYYLYQTSAFFEMTGPILAAIATMTVLGLLYRKSELQPVLAAGIPIWRLALPFLIGNLCISGALAANQELITPEIAPRLMSRDVDGSEGKSVEPVYDYQTGLHVDGEKLILAKQKLVSARMTLPSPLWTPELTTIESFRAFWHEGSDRTPSGWVLEQLTPPLEDLTLTEAGQAAIRPLEARELTDEDRAELRERKVPEANWPETVSRAFLTTDVSFDQLFHRHSSYKLLSTPELVERLRNPSYGMVSVSSQVMHLHTRLLRPIGGLITVFIIIPLVVRRESRSLIGDVAICAAVLIGVVVLNQAVGFAGGTYLPTAVAAWVPLIFSAALASWFAEKALT